MLFLRFVTTAKTRVRTRIIKQCKLYSRFSNSSTTELTSTSGMQSCKCQNKSPNILTGIKKCKPIYRNILYSITSIYLCGLDNQHHLKQLGNQLFRFYKCRKYFYFALGSFSQETNIFESIFLSPFQLINIFSGQISLSTSIRVILNLTNRVNF